MARTAPIALRTLTTNQDGQAWQRMRELWIEFPGTGDRMLLARWRAALELPQLGGNAYLRTIVEATAQSFIERFVTDHGSNITGWEDQKP